MHVSFFMSAKWLPQLDSNQRSDTCIALSTSVTSSSLDCLFYASRPAYLTSLDAGVGERSSGVSDTKKTPSIDGVLSVFK